MCLSASALSGVHPQSQFLRLLIQICENQHLTGVPKFKGDAICPVLDQCTALVQAKLKKLSPGKEGFDPDNAQISN